MNRVKLMWIIMIASAVTGVAQYVLMGVTGYNHDPQTFSWWFWVVEFCLWGVRALVESICVGYIFMTIATRWQDKLSLSLFETVILLEIAFTVGIMTAAVGSSKTIYTMLAELSGQYYFAWAFAMGAYAPLMMAGSGIAFRIQPVSAGQVVVNEEAIKDTEALRQHCADLQASNETLRLDNKYSQMWQVMSAIDKARVYEIVKAFANGNGPELERAAKIELTATARSRAKKG